MKYQIVICVSEGPNGPNKGKQIVNVTTSCNLPTEAIEEFAQAIASGAATCLCYEDPVAEYIVYKDELRVASGRA
jgi:hypothetical protein